jgi:hypothetical protein
MSIRIMKSDVWMVGLMHAISINEMRASGPWNLTSRREHTSSERLQLSSHTCVLERNLSTCQTLKSIEGSRHKGRSRQKVLIVRTNDAWIVEQLDGISRHPDGCKGSDFSDLESVHNLLETFLWKWRLWKYWTPDKKHHYMKVILSNKMQSITNQHI